MGKMDEVKRSPGTQFSYEEPEGTVLMRHREVRFFYGNGDYFDVTLGEGCLQVRVSGRNSDTLAVIPSAANEVNIWPRKWNHSRDCWEVR